MIALAHFLFLGWSLPPCRSKHTPFGAQPNLNRCTQTQKRLNGSISTALRVDGHTFIALIPVCIEHSITTNLAAQCASTQRSVTAGQTQQPRFSSKGQIRLQCLCLWNCGRPLERRRLYEQATRATATESMSSKQFDCPSITSHPTPCLRRDESPLHLHIVEDKTRPTLSHFQDLHCSKHS